MISGFVLKGFREYYVEFWYTLTSIISLGFRILVFYFLWLALVGNAAGAVLSYLILAQVFWYAGPTKVMKKINREVREGTFDLRLLRPASVPVQYLFEELGSNLLRFLTLFALLFLMFSYAGLSVNLLFLLPAFLISYLSHFLLFLSVGSLVFWFGDSKPFIWILSKLIMISQVVPHHYFPPIFQKIFDLLPGKYTVYYPVEMALEGTVFVEPLIYLAALFGISALAIRFGIRKVNVYGG